MPTEPKRPWSWNVAATLAGLPITTEVVEVQQSFHVDVISSDYEKAVCKDPIHCALSNAVSRQCGLPKNIHPVITSGSVYIPMRKGRKGWFLAKYRHTVAGRKLLIQFDETGIFPEGGITFVGLSNARKLENKRKYEDKRNQNRDRTKDERKSHQATKPNKIRQTFRPLSGITTKLAVSPNDSITV